MISPPSNRAISREIRRGPRPVPPYLREVVPSAVGSSEDGQAAVLGDSHAGRPRPNSITLSAWARSRCRQLALRRRAIASVTPARVRDLNAVREAGLEDCRRRLLVGHDDAGAAGRSRLELEPLLLGDPAGTRRSASLVDVREGATGAMSTFHPPCFDLRQVEEVVDQRTGKIVASRSDRRKGESTLAARLSDPASSFSDSSRERISIEFSGVRSSLRDM